MFAGEDGKGRDGAQNESELVKIGDGKILNCFQQGELLFVCLTLDCFSSPVFVISEKILGPHERVLILERYENELWNCFKCTRLGTTGAVVGLTPVCGAK